jgi:hypothetical protein
MTLRVFILTCALLWTLPLRAEAESCEQMAKELQKVRREYHEFVNHPTLEKGDLTFDEITARLDKIVDLKNKMRKAACKKIPPRPKF